MVGEYAQLKIGVEMDAVFRVEELLRAVFYEQGKSKRCRELKFTPFEGQYEADVRIFTVPDEFKTLVLRYKIPTLKGFVAREVDITRSQATRMVQGDYMVTDELPGRFPGDLNAHMLSQCYVASTLTQYTSGTFQNSVGDVCVDIRTDIGASTNVRGLFESVVFTPQHLGCAVVAVKYSGRLYGMQKEVIQEITKCGFPL